MSKAASGDREAAEDLAIQALNYLAQEPKRLARFLALSRHRCRRPICDAAARPAGVSCRRAGATLAIRTRPLLLPESAAEAGVTPAAVDRARRLLAGPDWERELP